MIKRDGYPAGVPCWIDIVQPDLDATSTFYGGLIGWDLRCAHRLTPSRASGRTPRAPSSR